MRYQIPSPFVLVVLLIALTQGACKIDLIRVATSGRDGWQQPERVVEALDNQPGDRVAEIGAGSGYWVPWLSRAVGPAGTVYAVDVEEEPIAELHRLVESEALSNVVVVYGEYADPLLPDGEIDLAITSLTYHHIEERPAFFSRLRADLSPRGRVAHLDDRHDISPPLRWLQSSGHWSDPESIRSEMALAGYRRSGDFDFLQTQSFQIFVPEERAAAR